MTLKARSTRDARTRRQGPPRPKSALSRSRAGVSAARRRAIDGLPSHLRGGCLAVPARNAGDLRRTLRRGSVGFAAERRSERWMLGFALCGIAVAAAVLFLYLGWPVWWDWLSSPPGLRRFNAPGDSGSPGLASRCEGCCYAGKHGKTVQSAFLTSTSAPSCAKATADELTMLYEVPRAQT